jgi:hypothetical protein
MHFHIATCYEKYFLQKLFSPSSLQSLQLDCMNNFRIQKHETSN